MYVVVFTSAFSWRLAWTMLSWTHIQGVTPRPQHVCVLFVLLSFFLGGTLLLKRWTCHDHLLGFDWGCRTIHEAWRVLIVIELDSLLEIVLERTGVRLNSLVQLHKLHRWWRCEFSAILSLAHFTWLLEPLRRLVVMQRRLMGFNCALIFIYPVSDQVSTHYWVFALLHWDWRPRYVPNLYLVLRWLRRHHVWKRGNLVE